MRQTLPTADRHRSNSAVGDPRPPLNRAPNDTRHPHTRLGGSGAGPTGRSGADDAPRPAGNHRGRDFGALIHLLAIVCHLPASEPGADARSGRWPTGGAESTDGDRHNCENRLEGISSQPLLYADHHPAESGGWSEVRCGALPPHPLGHGVRPTQATLRAAVPTMFGTNRMDWHGVAPQSYLVKASET